MTKHEPGDEFNVGDKGQSRDGALQAECVAVRDGRAIWFLTSRGSFGARITWLNGKCTLFGDSGDDIVPVPPPIKRVPYTRETWPAECEWILFQGDSLHVLRIGERTVTCREWTYRYEVVAEQCQIGSTMNGPWQPAYREVSSVD